MLDAQCFLLAPTGYAHEVTAERERKAYCKYHVNLDEQKHPWAKHESKEELPTIWTDGKPEVGSVREEKTRSEKIGERVRRKTVQVHEKVGKSRFTVFFQ